jgi:hypothetical protein
MLKSQEAVYSQLSNLNSRFAWMIDHQDGKDVENLFTPQGEYIFGALKAVGREQVRGFYQLRKSRGKRTSRHIFTNLVIHEFNDECIKASCILMLYAFDGDGPFPAEVHMVADYEDELRFDSDAQVWLYHQRIVKPVFGHSPFTSKPAA